MSRFFLRVFVAVLLALPGIGLAMSAKPLLLGEAALVFGILLAFALPAGYLLGRRCCSARGESADLPKSEK